MARYKRKPSKLAVPQAPQMLALLTALLGLVTEILRHLH